MYFARQLIPIENNKIKLVFRRYQSVINPLSQRVDALIDGQKKYWQKANHSFVRLESNAQIWSFPNYAASHLRFGYRSALHRTAIERGNARVVCRGIEESVYSHTGFSE